MPLPASIPLSSLGEPFYTGSVQRLYAIPEAPGFMVTETTSRGSVFDVGSIFEVPGSDVSRAVFRHMLYSRLAEPAFWLEVKESLETSPGLDPGLKTTLIEGLLETLCRDGAHTHHEGMIDAESGQIVRHGAPEHPSRFNVVRRFQILKPRSVEVLGRSLFDYTPFRGEDGFVVPLEYIVRFGLTGASSIYRRYLTLGEPERRACEAELGLTGPLEPWKLLDRPLADCTTKFEPEDRNLSLQEGLLVSSLPGRLFAATMELAVLGAAAVRHVLATAGLLLWDLKWEFATAGGDLVFVDTIDTDSFRATRSFDLDGTPVVVHFNKQALRDYYRIVHAGWIDGVNAAKSRARTQGRAFTELLREGQDSGLYSPTPQIATGFLAIQEAKMATIRDFMLQQLAPAQTREALDQLGRDEIDFYRGIGKDVAFAKFNRIP